MLYGMGPSGWGYHPYGFGGAFGYGRGRCWSPWWFGGPAVPWGAPNKEDEVRFLEEQAHFLRGELDQIEKRLEELKKTN